MSKEVKMAIKIKNSPNDLKFKEKINEISGENFFKCMQCGTCSSTCPMIESVDVHPRKLVHMLQMGLIDEVLASKICWTCASCHTCESRCPRGMELPKIMEAVRQIQLRQKMDKLALAELKKELISELPQMALISAFRKLTS